MICAHYVIVPHSFCTGLFSAKRMKNKMALDLLQSFGAKFSTISRNNEATKNSNACPELFKTARGSGEEDSAGRTIATPNINVSKIMSNFRERGERLEAISSKSSQLNNEAQAYEDLTRQLKDKLEKKNKSWLGI